MARKTRPGTRSIKCKRCKRWVIVSDDPKKRGPKRIHCDECRQIREQWQTA